MNKEIAANHIRRQPFFGDLPGEKEQLIARVRDGLERVQRTKGDASSEATNLMHRLLQHFAVYVERNGCLPGRITMKPHHWRELRSVGRWAGLVTHKKAEGRRIMGVQVELD